MGFRGRPAKPTNLKLIEGNPGKRKLETNEPNPEPVLAPPQGWLNAEAKGIWRRLMPELFRWGLVTKLDLDILAMYCDAVAEVHFARRKIARAGYEAKTPSGYRQQSHWIHTRNQAVKRAAELGTHFGLTPAARTRLKGTAQGELFDTPPGETPAARSGWDSL
jgi:P27 family predicted phage terminase small subunit